MIDDKEALRLDPYLNVRKRREILGKTQLNHKTKPNTCDCCKEPTYKPVKEGLRCNNCKKIYTVTDLKRNKY